MHACLGRSLNTTTANPSSYSCDCPCRPEPGNDHVVLGQWASPAPSSSMALSHLMVMHESTFTVLIFLFILKFIIWIHSYKSCRPPGPFPCPPGFLEGSASQYGWDLIPRSSRSSMIFLNLAWLFLYSNMDGTAAFVFDCFLFLKQF